jgi:hypothetical protein
MSRVISVLVVPVLFVALSVAAINATGNYSAFDPDYYYLLSALEIADGKSVGLFHHPGTTAEIVGAIVMQITRLVRFQQLDVETMVLQHPEAILHAIYFATTAVNAFALALLGFITLRVSGSALVTPLIQLSTVFAALPLIDSISRFKAEPFLLFSCVVLVALIVILIFDSRAATRSWLGPAMGLVCGFGIATKFTVAPLLIVPLIVLRGWRQRSLFVVGMLTGTLLFTIPIWDRAAQIYKWVSIVAFHVGLYGDGEAGLIKPDLYARNMIDLVTAHPSVVGTLLVAISVLAAILLRAGVPGLREPAARVLAALVCSHVIAIALVAKYYLTVGAARYLFTSFCLLGFTWVVAGLALRRAQVVRGARGVAVCAVVVIAAAGWHGFRDAQKIATHLAKLRDDSRADIRRERILQSATAAHAGYAQVYDYYYPTRVHGLMAASVYSTRYQPILKAVYPDVYFCYSGCDENTWTSQRLWDFAREVESIPVDALRAAYGDRIILIHGDTPTITRVGRAHGHSGER